MSTDFQDSSLEEHHGQEEHDRPVDLLIITALTEEAQVVSAVLSEVATEVCADEGVTFYNYPLGETNLARLATASAHEMGATSIGIFAAPLLQRLSPLSTTLVGIAAAVDVGEVELGDVPFASQVLSYDDIAVDKDGVLTFRSEGYPADPRMRHAAGALRTTTRAYSPWQEQCAVLIDKVIEIVNNLRPRKIKRPKKKLRLPHLVVDPIAGGPFLLRDRGFRDSLRRRQKEPDLANVKVAAPLHPKLLSAEMESHGFMKAALANGIGATVIKGISDDGDDTKADLEKRTGGFYRAYACSNAVLAALHILHRYVAQKPTKTASQTSIEQPALAENPPRGRAIANAVDTIIEKLYLRRKLSPGSPEDRANIREIEKAVQLIRRDFSPEAGSVVADGRLERIIGYGSFGAVWEAYDEKLGKKVAVKIFRQEALAEGQMLFRFGRGIRAMRLLAEPARRKRSSMKGNIVEFYKKDPTGLGFSMRLYEGGDLTEIERRKWSREKKIQIMLDICAALEYSHENGIIHRDIKPANIVLDAREQPVLTDFDIADIKYATSLSTSVEGGLGTPIFAAPEQLSAPTQRPDERADIYSLGRLLHFLLIERPPSLDLDIEGVLRNLSMEPPALVEVVRRAIQRNPERRFRSVSEMRRTLETCMTGTAAAKVLLLRSGRAMKRNWQIGTITALIIAFLTTMLFVQNANIEKERAATALQQEAADRERGLRSEADKARKQTEEAYARFEELSQMIAESSVQERDLVLEKNRLEMRIKTRSEELSTMKIGSALHAQLSSTIADDKALLEEVLAGLTQLERERHELEEELDGLRRWPTGGVSPEQLAEIESGCNDFRDGSGCKAFGDYHRRQRDYSSAYQYYKKSCYFKHAEGCTDQAYLLITGKGPEEERRAAMGILEHACESLRYGKACWMLGYHKRLGKKDLLDRDLEDSYRLYSKACFLWEPRGCKAIFRHFAERIENDSERLNLRKISCIQGVIVACDESYSTTDSTTTQEG